MVSSGDSESEEYNTDNEKRKKAGNSKFKKRRVQLYRVQWEFEFKWLQPVKDKLTRAQCRACSMQFRADIGVIKKHAECLKHKQNLKRIDFQPGMDVVFQKNTFDHQVKRAELKICALLAEHNIAFLANDHLIPLLQDCFPDSAILKQISLARTKATGVTKNVIGQYEFKWLTLKQIQFSILVDESTDIASTKTMAICVQFFCSNQRAIKTQFFTLLQVFSKEDHDGANAGATAENVYNDIINVLTTNNIPLDNLIGFGSDGCNVMFGRHNSVVSRLTQDFPGIFTSKCICHSLHLCASEACKVLPRETEALVRDIYTFFSHSAKRQAQLGEFQEFCHVEPHKILRPAQTRWLSLTQVVNRIKNQWGALELYFRHNFLEHRLTQSEHIWNSLTNSENKLFYFFLDWILPKFSQANAYFQSEKVILTRVHKKMVCLFKELLLTYMDAHYVNKTNLSEINPEAKEHYLTIQNMYLGYDVLNNIALLNNTQKNDFLIRVQRFLVTACNQIKNRYDFSNPMLSQIHILEPDYKDRPFSLHNLLTASERICKNLPVQQIDDEWRSLKISEDDKQIRDLEIDKYWAEIYNMKDQEGHGPYRNLAKFILAVLSYPHSNAEVERVFSKVNLVKTRVRNKLITETVEGILLTNQAVKKQNGCVKFEPTKEMIYSMKKDIIYSKNEIDMVDIHFE